MQLLKLSKPITFEWTATHILISIQISLNGDSNYSHCTVIFVDDYQNEIDKRHIQFTKEELDAWGEDDSVLVNMIVQKLDLK